MIEHMLLTEDGAEGGEEDGDVDMDESNRWSF